MNTQTNTGPHTCRLHTNHGHARRGHVYSHPRETHILSTPSQSTSQTITPVVMRSPTLADTITNDELASHLIRHYHTTLSQYNHKHYHTQNPNHTQHCTHNQTPTNTHSQQPNNHIITPSRLSHTTTQPRPQRNHKRCHTNTNTHGHNTATNAAIQHTITQTLPHTYTRYTHTHTSRVSPPPLLAPSPPPVHLR